MTDSRVIIVVGVCSSLRIRPHPVACAVGSVAIEVLCIACNHAGALPGTSLMLLRSNELITGPSMKK